MVMTVVVVGLVVCCRNSLEEVSHISLIFVDPHTGQALDNVPWQGWVDGTHLCTARHCICRVLKHVRGSSTHGASTSEHNTCHVYVPQA